MKRMIDLDYLISEENKEELATLPLYSIIDVGFTPLNLSFEIGYDEDAQTINLNIYTNTIKEYFELFFSHKKFICSIKKNQDITLHQVRSKLYAAWNNYINYNTENLENQFRAYKWKYSPLDNNDRYEKITIEYQGVEKESTTRATTKSGNITFLNGKTLVKSGDIETLRSGSLSNTKTGSIENSNELKGYDSNAFTNPSKTTETYNNVADTQTFNNLKDKQTFNDVTETNSGTDTQTFNNVKDENSGDISKSFENRKDITSNHTHGNIGTTKSTEMMLDEIHARTQDLIYNFIKRFCDLYTIW